MFTAECGCWCYLEGSPSHSVESHGVYIHNQLGAENRFVTLQLPDSLSSGSIAPAAMGLEPPESVISGFRPSLVLVKPTSNDLEFYEYTYHENSNG